jgi:hypothetical protein
LLADADQRAALQATLALTNQAANLASDIAWQRRVFRTYGLQQLTYGQLRALGLSAQPAVRVIKKVADAYKLDRRTKRTFRADAAQPYDDRCLSWQPDQQTVSIWTVAGRLKGIRFATGEQQRRVAPAVGMSTGPTARTKLPSAASRAASLGTPTGTQPATSPSAVVRAGLPPTSRTRTGDSSPELQAIEQLAHPLCTMSRRPDLARRYHVAVVPAAFRVAGDGTVLERLA